jgi:PAS domain S-box-containing protein
VKNINKTKEQFMNELVKMRQRIKKLEAEKKVSYKEKDNLENALRDWQSTFDSAKDLILVLDTKFKIIKANLATSNFLKRPLRDIYDKTCYELIHGINKPPKECPLNLIKKSKKREEAECYLSKKDIWLQVTVDPIFDKNGKMTKIVLIIRDITEFRRTETSLRESEGRFRAIFDHVNHGIHVVDIDARKTLMANKTLCQMLGYSKEEFKKLRVDDIHPQEDMPFIIEQYRKLVREEMDIARDIPVLSNDGSVFYTDVSAVPFMLGGKTYLMVIFRDLTEVKKHGGN